MFVSLQGSSFSSIAGTYARIEDYSGEGKTSTASVPRGLRDRVFVCFSMKISFSSSAGTDARLEEYSYA
jgi:hypothetical protein